jgi:uncharacterized protein with LGFP repeats
VPTHGGIRIQAPSIITRGEWLADESIGSVGPQLADRLVFVVIHHTGGRVDYEPCESAAIVRAIHAYHVLARGWNDIGYNFLVDAYGQVFEGRAGGVDRNVVGAHALGFNQVSVGIALIGRHDDAEISPAAGDALAHLVAWRLGLAGTAPDALVEVVSSGGHRHPEGTSVVVPALAGHRDVGRTDCPGDALYAQLDALASRAADLTAARPATSTHRSRAEQAPGLPALHRALAR